MAGLQRLVTRYGPIEYRETGSGQPVVVFHGGQGSALNDTFDHVLDLRRFRIIVPSRPGYLGTSLGANGSAEATARLVHALVETLGTGPVGLISISLGARAAIAFGAQYPEMTRALVLSSPILGPYAPRGSLTHRLARIFYNRWTEAATWWGTRLAFRLLPRTATRMFLHSITRRRIEPLTPRHIAVVRERIFNLRSYAGLLVDLEQSVSEAMIAAIQCPTLIQHSINDPSISEDHPRLAARLIEGSELCLYDNDLGHFLWVGPGSEQAVGDIRSFIERHCHSD